MSRYDIKETADRIRAQRTICGYTQAQAARRLEIDRRSMSHIENGTKTALKDCVSAALAGEERGLTLPAVESQIKALQERQMELFQLAVGAGADCTEYDEEIRQVNEAKIALMAKKAELERQGRTAAEFERRMGEITAAVDTVSTGLSCFDDITVRQLISNIKVLNKERLLIRFKDGTEIEQATNI